MMTPAIAAIYLLAGSQSSNQTGLHWPIVPNPLFALNGIDANGSATLTHVKISGKAGVTSIGKPHTGVDGSWASLSIPPSTYPWKTLQLAFTFSADGPLASFGGIQLCIKDGWIWFHKGQDEVKVARIKTGDLNFIQLLRERNTIKVFANGMIAPESVVTAQPLYPLEIGLDPFKGAFIGIAAYPQILSTDELVASYDAAQAIAKPLFVDTLKARVEGVLTGITPVPELERIRPYRSALLAEEYKITRIASGRMSAIKPGMKVRIFRYGIKAGVKTALKTAKIGDRAIMLIQAYDSDPKFSREFQVDNLDPDISIPLFVDVTPLD